MIIMLRPDKFLFCLAMVLSSEFLYVKYPPFSLNLTKTEPELK